jgi:hypothetical protein
MGATLLSPQTLQQADRFPDEEDEPAYSISQIALDFAQEGRKGMKTKSQANQVFFVARRRAAARWQSPLTPDGLCPDLKGYEWLRGHARRFDFTTRK